MSLVVCYQMRPCFRTCFTDELQQDGRVDVLLAVFGGNVQVWPGTTSGVATDCHHLSGQDLYAFLYQCFRQMAITDCVVTVTDGHIVARTLVG